MRAKRTYECQEHDVEPIEAGEDAVEAFQSTERPLEMIATTIHLAMPDRSVESTSGLRDLVVRSHRLPRGLVPGKALGPS